MNKRIIFNAQGGESPAWDIYLDFKHVGTVNAEAVADRFAFTFLVYVSDFEVLDEVFDTKEEVVRAIETACAEQLAKPPVKQELRIERDEGHCWLGYHLSVYVGELRLGGFWLKTDSRYSDHAGMIEADWLRGVGGFDGWLNPPRFASEVEMLHFIGDTFREELGL